jgi:hypothetical protein
MRAARIQITTAAVGKHQQNASEDPKTTAALSRRHLKIDLAMKLEVGAGVRFCPGSPHSKNLAATTETYIVNVLVTVPCPIFCTVGF